MKLVLEDVLAKNGDFVLGPVDASLNTERPQVLMVLGANGAGKSTLLKAIAGIIELERGRIFVNGGEISSLAPQKRKIGLVSQEPYLFPSMSAENNILFGAKDKSVALEVTKALGIEGIIKRKPSELSGGEQQRVSIARALATEPSLLLMDEPFSHLDRAVQVQMRSIVKRIVETNRTDVIYVTHNVEEAYSMGDQLLFMDKGRFIESLLPIAPGIGGDGTNSDMSRPKSRKFAELLGYRNFISGRVVSLHGGMLDIETDGKTFQGLGDENLGKEVSLAIRPEDIVLSTARPSSSSQRNMIKAKIIGLEVRGPVAEVLLQDKEQERVVLLSTITTNSVSDLGLKIGRDVYALFKATAAHTVLD